MSVTAKSVGKSNLAIKETEENVKMILDAIDVLISEHPAEIGLNKVHYNLPTAFTNMITNTSAKNATVQIMVYGQVCMSLQERGFKVALVIPPKGNNYIVVSWIATFENELFDKCKKLLSECKFNSEEDADKFLQAK